MSVNASPSGSGSSGSCGNNNSGGGGSPCGACKFLRRKCVPGCIFAPYFDSEQGAANFAAVHKVFGASNVSKMLLNIPIHKRHDAVVTICYEAESRLRDPVYGCVSHIYALHQQVVSLQAELSYIQGHLAPVELPHPAPPQVTMGSPPSRAFLPTNILANTFSSMQGIYDLSSLYDPIVQAVWAPQHQPPIAPPEYVRSGPSPTVIGGDNGGCGDDGSSDNNKGDFQAFAQELLHRDASPTEVPLPCPNAPSPNASSAPSLSK